MLERTPPMPAPVANGTGDNKYEDLCKFSCVFGYCPLPCICTDMGPPNPLPVVPGKPVYACPVSGLDSTYAGQSTMSQENTLH